MAETTRVVRIVQKPVKAPLLFYRGQLLAEGSKNICLQLKNYNKEGRDIPATDLDDEFIVHAPIVALKGIPLFTFFLFPLVYAFVFLFFSINRQSILV